MDFKNVLSVLLYSSLWMVCAATDSAGTWDVGTCIKFKMDAHMTILPDPQDVNKTIQVIIPKTANSTGACLESSSNQTERIDLFWQEMDKEVNKPLGRYVNFTFRLNDTAPSPYYGLYRIEGVYETRYFYKNVTVQNKTVPTQETEFVTFTTYDQTPLDFQTPVNMTYMCKDIGKLSMHSELHDTSEPRGASGKKLYNVTFTAKEVWMNAFRPANVVPAKFQASLDCSYRPSDVVPIIVGCALAGTVLLVLVAYLVGRRRNRAAGYQSV